MKIDKIFTAIAAIGFWGMVFHPAMVAVLIIGLIGYAITYTPTTNEQE